MRKLLLQLDSSRLPSVFDRVVAYDGGADEVMSYGAIAEADVRDLVHGTIFTRGAKHLQYTSIFVGGSDMAAGDRLLAAVRKEFFGPFRVSVMLDSNGSNTTAVAAVAKIQQVAGDLAGKRAVVTAGTGPVGTRAAGLMARAGADVLITSRAADVGDRAAEAIARRFGGRVSAKAVSDPSHAAEALEGAHILCNAGPVARMLVPQSAWLGRAGLQVAVDLNAVPPLGIEGIDVGDAGVERKGVICFGALGVGGFKMKVHKACIARMFERNDLVFDAETIADLALALAEK